MKKVLIALIVIAPLIGILFLNKPLKYPEYPINPPIEQPKENEIPEFWLR